LSIRARHRLEYSRAYFRGEFRHRDVNVILITIVLGAMCAAWGWAAGRALPMLFRAAAFAGCAFTGAAFAYFAYGIVTDRRRTLVIGPGGIIAFGRLTPWSKIIRFAAYLQPNGRSVVLFFTTGRLGLPHSFACHPGTTPAEYEKLVSVLRAEIAPLHPRLEIGGYFTDCG
jgi:hypothetical protein